MPTSTVAREDAPTPYEDDSQSVREAKALAKEARAGRAVPAVDLIPLVRKLVDEGQFEVGRRLLEAAGATPATERSSDRDTLVRQRVFCTYKSEDLPARKRLADAYDLLSREVDLGDRNASAAFLGLAGAIWKRMWQAEGSRRALGTSLAFFRRGVGSVGSIDQYCAVNAAYVLDELARLEEDDARKARAGSSLATSRREEARALRAMLLTEEPPPAADPLDDWYRRISLGEAALGLVDLGRARDELEAAAALPGVPAWRKASAFGQLSGVAGNPGEPDKGAPAARIVAEAFGVKEEAVVLAGQGKSGIALSGGGVRAALFHVGVLSALAEEDRLRRVEVISCVSGGSLVGVAYYLLLRQLLQETCECRIGRDSYVEVVRQTAALVRKLAGADLRSLAFDSLSANLRLLFTRWTRTQALGVALEKVLLAAAAGADAALPLELAAMKIEPARCGRCAVPASSDASRRPFSPKLDNWGRTAKVPILILNASCLNTGHAWQFTSSWVGEPPTSMDAQLDAIPRLRRVRLRARSMPAAHRGLLVREAVAASCGVPALLAPLQIQDLYPGVAVSLVDGGVQDNQGIGGLLDQGCTSIAVSDASGQMPYDARPGQSMLPVVFRANEALSARIRELQLGELELRHAGGQLRELLIVHLTKGLHRAHVDWIGCDDPKAESAAGPGDTDYGVDRAIQELLAGVRTDLDVFAAAEQDALITSGYRMTKDEVAGPDGPAPRVTAVPDWLGAGRAVKALSSGGGSGAERARLAGALSAAHHRTFKVTRRVLAKVPLVSGALRYLGASLARGGRLRSEIRAGIVVLVSLPLLGVAAMLKLLALVKLGLLDRLYRRLSG